MTINKILLFCSAALLILTGCMRAENTNSSLDRAPDLSENTDQERLISCEKDGKIQEFEADGDAVVRSKQTFILPYESLSLPENLPAEEARKQAAEAVKNSYAQIGGVRVTANPQDNGIHVEVSIDYTAANPEQLAAHKLITEAEMQNRFVSADKTAKALESAGYACSIEVKK